MSLRGTIVDQIHLNAAERREMFGLMNLYYENLVEEKFYEDLSEKDWVLVLYDKKGAIKGFSTLMAMDMDLDGRTVKGVFSGDTIIHRDYWGTVEFLIVWGRFVLMDLPELFAPMPVYWILISKGYKTYRYLPTHFLEFFPRYDRETPAGIQRIMDAFGRLKYPDRYDAGRGIITSDGNTDRVKDGIAPLTEKHLQDPNLAFFARKNPGHEEGEELVCIVRAAFDNLQPPTQQMLLLGQPYNRAASQ